MSVLESTFQVATFRSPPEKTHPTKNTGPTPQILIASSALEKMGAYVGSCTQEIGWLGTVVRDGSTYMITDVFLFLQDVHSTTTEITPEGLVDFTTRILEAYPFEHAAHILNSLRVWGHSHVRMQTFASGQDNAQMKVFEKSTMETPDAFMVRIIANKLQSLRVDVYDFQNNEEWHELPWSVMPDDRHVDLEDVLNDMKTLVRQKVYAPYVPSKPSGSYPSAPDLLTPDERSFYTDYDQDEEAVPAVKPRKRWWQFWK